jgi:hypothetical protein
METGRGTAGAAEEYRRKCRPYLDVMRPGREGRALADETLHPSSQHRMGKIPVPDSSCGWPRRPAKPSLLPGSPPQNPEISWRSFVTLPSNLCRQNTRAAEHIESVLVRGKGGHLRWSSAAPAVPLPVFQTEAATLLKKRRSHDAYF